VFGRISGETSTSLNNLNIESTRFVFRLFLFLAAKWPSHDWYSFSVFSHSPASEVLPYVIATDPTDNQYDHAQIVPGVIGAIALSIIYQASVIAMIGRQQSRSGMALFVGFGE
jgi:hypothetical protein